MSGSMTWDSDTHDDERYYGADDIDRDVTGKEQAEMDEDRITKAIDAAELEFWREIHKQFPEIKTGEFPLFGEDELKSALGTALRLWLMLNAKE